MVKPKAYRKPFLGRVFYLDVTKYRGLAKLEANLQLLGATLERCFSKEVHCLVTDDPKYTARQRTAIGTSPSVPSPGTPSPISAGLVRGAVDSPPANSPGEGGAAASNKTFTRAQRCVEIGKRKSYGNLIENAEKWKIKVITLEKALLLVEKYLFSMPQSVKDAAANRTKGNSTDANKKPKKLKKLRGNFVKFEAAGRHYRPLYQEFEKGFPQIDLARPIRTRKANTRAAGARDPQVGTLEEGERAEIGNEEKEIATGGESLDTGPPRNTPKTNTTASNSRRRTPGKGSKKKSLPASTNTKDVYDFLDEDGCRRIATAGEVKRQQQEKARADRLKGYCEMCKVNYDNIRKHQWTPKHREFITNVDNFIGLDNMIETGPNLEQFLQDVMKYHKDHMKEGMDESEMEDEVLLIREGLASPLVRAKNKKKLLKDAGIKNSFTSSTTNSKKKLSFTGSQEVHKRDATYKSTSTNSPPAKKLSPAKRSATPVGKNTKGASNSGMRTSARQLPSNNTQSPGKKTQCNTRNSGKDQQVYQVMKTPTNKQTRNRPRININHSAKSDKNKDTGVKDGKVKTPSKAGKQVVAVEAVEAVEGDDHMYEIVSPGGKSPITDCTIALNYVATSPGEVITVTQGAGGVEGGLAPCGCNVSTGGSGSRSRERLQLKKTSKNRHQCRRKLSVDMVSEQQASCDSGIHISHSSPTVVDATKKPSLRNTTNGALPTNTKSPEKQKRCISGKTPGKSAKQQQYIEEKRGVSTEEETTDSVALLSTIPEKNSQETVQKLQNNDNEVVSPQRKKCRGDNIEENHSANRKGLRQIESGLSPGRTGRSKRVNVLGKDAVTDSCKDDLGNCVVKGRKKKGGGHGNCSGVVENLGSASVNNVDFNKVASSHANLNSNLTNNSRVDNVNHHPTHNKCGLKEKNKQTKNKNKRSTESDSEDCGANLCPTADDAIERNTKKIQANEKKSKSKQRDELKEQSNPNEKRPENKKTMKVFKSSGGGDGEDKKEKSHKKKIRKKLKESIQVLSDRSMKLMFDSEGDNNHDFEGYTAESMTESQLPVDVSYLDLTEIEFSEDSEVEWIFSEADRAQTTPVKALPASPTKLMEFPYAVDAASCGWSEQVDKYVNRSTEPHIRQLCLGGAGEEGRELWQAAEQEAGEELEKVDASSDASEDLLVQSYEKERSVTEAHKGDLKGMLNHVFSRYLTGSDFEPLWLDDEEIKKRKKSALHKAKSDCGPRKSVSFSLNASGSPSKLTKASGSPSKLAKTPLALHVDTSNTSVENEGQVSPEIPFIGKSSPLRNAKQADGLLLEENTALDGELPDQPVYKGFQGSSPLSLRTLQPPSAGGDAAGLTRLQTGMFDGLMHSTPVGPTAGGGSRANRTHAQRSGKSSNTTVNSPKSPFGIPVPSHMQASKRLKMAAINKVVQNLNEHVTKMMSPPRVQRKNTRKSLSDAFQEKADDQPQQPCSSSPLSSHWEVDDEDNHGGEIQVDNDIVFNYNSPQKASCVFSPLKSSRENSPVKYNPVGGRQDGDISFLRHLNSSQLSSGNKRTPVKRSLSGTMLSQAGLQISTLLTKRSPSKEASLAAISKVTKSPVTRATLRRAESRKLIKGDSQQFQNNATYKFVYMATSPKKKKKKSPGTGGGRNFRLKWYTNKVSQSKKRLNALALEKGSTVESDILCKDQADSDILCREDDEEMEDWRNNGRPAAKRNTRSAQKQSAAKDKKLKALSSDKKKLSPRRSRMKSNKSVFSFRSSQTYRMDLMLRKLRKRGCLCHEHLPGSTCPNADEYKRLKSSPLTRRSRSRSRTPLKKIVSPLAAGQRKRLPSASPGTRRAGRGAARSRSRSTLAPDTTASNKPVSSRARKSSRSPVKEKAVPARRSLSMSAREKNTEIDCVLTSGDTVRENGFQRLITDKRMLSKVVGRNDVYDYASPLPVSPLRKHKLLGSGSRTNKTLSKSHDRLSVQNSDKKESLTSSVVRKSLRSSSANAAENVNSQSLENSSSAKTVSVDSGFLSNSQRTTTPPKSQPQSAGVSGRKLSLSLKKRSLRSLRNRQENTLVKNSPGSSQKSSGGGDTIPAHFKTKKNYISRLRNSSSSKKRTRSAAELELFESNKDPISEIRHSRRSLINKGSNLSDSLSRTLLSSSRSKRALSPSEESVSSANSDGLSSSQHRQSALLKRLNIQLTDAQLCAMFVPTKTRSLGSGSIEGSPAAESILSGLIVPSRNSNSSTVSKVKTDDDPVILSGVSSGTNSTVGGCSSTSSRQQKPLNRTPHVRSSSSKRPYGNLSMTGLNIDVSSPSDDDLTLSPPKKRPRLSVSMIEGDTARSLRSPVGSAASVSTLDRVVLNSPDRKLLPVFKQKKLAVQLSPLLLSPRTTSRLGQILNKYKARNSKIGANLRRKIGIVSSVVSSDNLKSSSSSSVGGGSSGVVSCSNKMEERAPASKRIVSRPTQQLRRSSLRRVPRPDYVE